MSDITPPMTEQSDEEFQAAMPISGRVETFFGNFELDHCFPDEGHRGR